MSVLNRALPKWSLMYVHGEPVTREQAAEVIVRCSNLDFSCTNDYVFWAELLRVMGVTVEEGTYKACGDAVWKPHGREPLDALREELQCLRGIEYLQLSSRVLSAYIAGPHGWLAWDGNIFTNSYNIGKWPSVTAVRDEWRTIAEAFPFLNLRCVLLDGEEAMEPGDQQPVPVVEYSVKDGKVRTMEPKTEPKLNPSARQVVREMALSFLNNRFRERGTTIDNFKWALEITRERVHETEML